SGAVIHLPRTGRYGSFGESLATSPPRNFGGTSLADSGKKSLSRLRPLPSCTPILELSAPLFMFLGLSGWTFEKNAAMPQYSVCFHSVNGWLWHWAHCSCTPRKLPLTLSVSLSTDRFARKNVTAGLSSTVPDAVT